MSSSQGLTVIGYPVGAQQVATGYDPHPTDERTDRELKLPIILAIIVLVVLVCIMFLWTVPTIQLGYPKFEQVESATVTSQLNATVSEWNITLFSINPRHRRISIEVLEALAIYGNHKFGFNTSPESFVLNKKSQTLLNMKLATGIDVGKEVDYDNKSKGFMSFGLRLSGCGHREGSPWIRNCFTVKCDPINLGFNDNGTATMNEHAQCSLYMGVTEVDKI